MIKRTLYFGHAVKIRCKNNQLRIIYKDDTEKTVPLEDIAFMIVDHYSVYISHFTMAEILNHNIALITTDHNHMPAGLFLPLAANTEQSGSIQIQLDCKLTLKKQLWQKTIKSKIKNQSNLLDGIGQSGHPLTSMIKNVRSDDVTNEEAAAAKVYWKLLFDPIHFKRHRYGKPPNNLLNYGYAILRAVIARALCGTGLLPMVGIHHKSRYNPFPLADDIMEPYRPFVDRVVWDISREEIDATTLTTDIKKRLLEIPSLGVEMKAEIKPLYLAAARTAFSLKKCFEKENSNIIYPLLK